MVLCYSATTVQQCHSTFDGVLAGVTPGPRERLSFSDVRSCVRDSIEPRQVVDVNLRVCNATQMRWAGVYIAAEGMVDYIDLVRTCTVQCSYAAV